MTQNCGFIVQHCIIVKTQFDDWRIPSFSDMVWRIAAKGKHVKKA